jgi:hypothetical protein
MTRLFRFLPVAAFCFPPLLVAPASEPAWWLQRGVIALDAGTGQRRPSQDFAAINQGQLKNLVVAAVAELNANLPNGAGAALTALTASWVAPPTGDRQDHAAVNAGQLKNVAKLVYERLIAEGIVDIYPWEWSFEASADYALVNIGQAKALFAFNLDDVDRDGLNRAQELSAGTNWLIADTDGDGVVDGLDSAPMNPSVSLPPANPADTTAPAITLTRPFEAALIP